MDVRTMNTLQSMWEGYRKIIIEDVKLEQELRQFLIIEQLVKDAFYAGAIGFGATMEKIAVGQNTGKLSYDAAHEMIEGLRSEANRYGQDA